MLKETADRRDSPFCDQLAGMLEAKVIGHTFLANSRDPDCDVDQLFKLDCPAVVASCADARPAELLPLHVGNHAQPKAAEKFMLRLLHVGEEYGEVNDPRHIGIAKLYATSDLKRLGQACSSSLRGPIQNSLGEDKN